MRADMLPSDEEVLALVPAAGSITWTRAADARTLLAAGYALLLQVAHPTVGAGVAAHSDYREQPWTRLFRTLDLTSALIYSEPAVAATVARAVRARHTTIRGVRPDGSRYHALEPAAYSWVWASLFGSIVAAHQRFGVRLGDGERERFWGEWRALGRLLGVRHRDLPATLPGFDAYWEHVVRHVLEDNDSVQGVIASLSSPPVPSRLQHVPLAWRLGTLPGAHALQLATAGLLPAVLRQRFGIGWSLANECELRAIAAASRSLTPLMPRPLREFGPSYLHWRAGDGKQSAIASGSAAA